MKPPPEDESLDELNAATRPRKARGKWRIIVVVAITLVLLALGVLVVLDTHRQSGIRDSRDRYTQELAQAQARYAGVNDWPAWYTDMLPPDCNQTALPKWIENCNNEPAVTGKVCDWANSLVGYELKPGEEPTPTEKELDDYLAATSNLADEAHAMLAYAHVSRPPHFDDGAVWFDVIPPLFAFKMLLHRVAVLRWTGDWQAAWSELDMALQLIQKWDHPCALVDMMIIMGVERTCHGYLGAMAGDNPPPDRMLERWRHQPVLPPRLDHELIEYELAFYVQRMALFDPDDEEFWESLTEQEADVRFGYLSPTLDWDDRKAAYNGTWLVLDAMTDHLRQLRSAVENPRARMSDFDEDNPMLSYFRGAAKKLFVLSLARQTSALLSSILLARGRGELQSAIGQTATEFPDHEAYLDGDKIVIRVRYDKRLLKQLPEEYEDRDEFYEQFEPIRLPLKP